MGVLKRIWELSPWATVNIECYRCDSCRRVVTSLDIAHVNITNEGEEYSICPCGANQFRPTNPSLKEKIMVVLRYIVRGY